MADLTPYVLALVPLAIAGGLIWFYLRKQNGAAGQKKDSKAAYQGVVKKDWVATGRIDFATQDDAGTDDAERPAEFRLLVEERRIVESIAGNANLEIQWRLATLKEAKVVIAQYHKYLADHGLIRTIAEEQAAAAALAASMPATAAPMAPAMPAAAAPLPASETPPAPAPAIEAPPTEAVEPPPARTTPVPAVAFGAASEPEAEPTIRVVAGSGS
jgi:hypothetical protein